MEPAKLRGVLEQGHGVLSASANCIGLCWVQTAEHRLKVK